MSELFVEVPGGKVWVEATGDGPALVVLHGGPGAGSDYLLPLKEICSQGFSVIRYDQLGCGRSKADITDSLLEIPRFVEELKLVLEMCARTPVHLLGHSWGAVIAAEFALRYPHAVSSIIFASPAINIPRWRADAERLRKRLPMMTQILLSEAERRNDFSFVECARALREFYARFVNGVSELPEEILSINQTADWDVYRKMWGPNELIIDGTLKDYDVTPRLKDISVPVMLNCGREDLSTPEALEEYAGQLRRAKVVVFEKSAHFPHITEKIEYNRRLIEWLNAQRA